jgi:beta-N-acetylhexosaminidase
MDQDQPALPADVSGTGRRGVLKNAMTLGAVAGLLSGTPAAASASPVAGAGGLTPRQLAGQRVIYSYPGRTVPAALLQAISAGQAAGVIFFADNIGSDAQITAAIRQLVQAARRSPVAAPLLLMTDQEGGEVRRLPGAPALSEKQIGASANPARAAGQAGTAAGQNLAGVGMNVNLAPVLDVYAAPGDFIDQFQRSYSGSASVVAGCGKAFITAQQHAKVAATAKHFPGLGSAGRAQNTDTGAVTLPVPLSQLRGREEAPYVAAIAAGVKLIMVSWAVYPALDRTRPAGLSSAVVQGELRGRLGYRGVTITDALEAGALTAFGGYGPRAVLAAGAGMDLLLCSARDPGQGAAVTSALASALQAGKLSAGPFSAAVQRVTALRNSLR